MWMGTPRSTTCPLKAVQRVGKQRAGSAGLLPQRGRSRSIEQMSDINASLINVNKCNNFTIIFLCINNINKP